MNLGPFTRPQEKPSSMKRKSSLVNTIKRRNSNRVLEKNSNYGLHHVTKPEPPERVSRSQSQIHIPVQPLSAGTRLRRMEEVQTAVANTDWSEVGDLINIDLFLNKITHLMRCCNLDGGTHC